MKLLFRYSAEIVWSSVNPFYYRKIVQRSAWVAFGYFLFFTFLHGLVLSGIVLWWLSGSFHPWLDKIQARLPEIQIRMEGGHFSTDLPQPFAEGNLDFSLIIDTTGRVSNLRPYKSAILILETKAVFKKDRFETREYSFSQIPNFSLSKTQVVEVVRNQKGVILWSLFLFLALLLFPSLWLAILMILPIFALFLLVPCKIFRSDLRYGQILAITFYAVTLPTLVQTGRIMEGSFSLGLPLGIYLLWSGLAFWSSRNAGN